MSQFEDNEELSWTEFIEALSGDYLQAIEIFFKKDLTKEEFFNAIDGTLPKSCSHHIINLFNLITNNSETTITWGKFLDFLIQNTISISTENNINFHLNSIIAVPQTKRETVVKIVLIETEKYFCYAIVSKHGKIGLYDGHLNFLTSYQVIMTREDINRNEEERRRRNRWVTDAIFCSDVQMFLVTNTARSIVIYEASGLKHVPLWILLTTPNVINCFTYRSSDETAQSTLFAGDSGGNIISFSFLQPKASLLRKKHNDKVNLFYWQELYEEKDFIKIRKIEQPFKETVKQIKYLNDTLISCSTDSNVSLIIKCLNNKVPSNVFKMDKGCNCFVLSQECKLLVTGSSNGIIRLWNPIITSKPVAILKDHQASIVNIKILSGVDLFLSVSSDGMLKLWNISEQKCIQSLTINFPSFSIFGKLIEWGCESIYPGPKREDSLKVWDRSPILVACCNHIAIIEINFENGTKTNILPPPPLQNSVLIPKMWKTNDQIEKLPIKEENLEIDEALIAEKLKDLDFIVKKDLFADKCINNSDINFKIAQLERQKLEMKEHVVRGAPYLALDLYEVKDISLTPNLPVPNKKRTKHLVEKIQELLQNASSRDVIFSELSSSHSPKSSRSSFVEFD